MCLIWFLLNSLLQFDLKPDISTQHSIHPDAHAASCSCIPKYFIHEKYFWTGSELHANYYFDTFGELQSPEVMQLLVSIWYLGLDWGESFWVKRILLIKYEAWKTGVQSDSKVHDKFWKITLLYSSKLRDVLQEKRKGKSATTCFSANPKSC